MREDQSQSNTNKLRYYRTSILIIIDNVFIIGVTLHIKKGTNIRLSSEEDISRLERDGEDLLHDWSINITEYILHNIDKIYGLSYIFILIIICSLLLMILFSNTVNIHSISI